MPLGRGLAQVWWRGQGMPSSSKERLLVKVPGLQSRSKGGKSQVQGQGSRKHQIKAPCRPQGKLAGSMLGPSWWLPKATCKL